MSCIDLYLIEKVYPAKFFSIHCVNTSRLKLSFQSNVFDDVRNKLVSAHCPVTVNVLTMTDENHKRCIFRILPVNVPRSYMHCLCQDWFNTSSSSWENWNVKSVQAEEQKDTQIDGYTDDEHQGLVSLKGQSFGLTHLVPKDTKA